MVKDELINILLENRGILDNAEKEKFLNPSYEEGLYDPFLIKNMERAVVRIFEAIDINEKIVIFADYDCDGIPGAVILQDLFKKINYKNYEIYIPDRQSEGYGLSEEAINEFIKNEVKLLITVDLGITAVKEIANAQANGIDVIVTDHHLPAQAGLPPAYAILNSKQDDDNYPDKNLCGAGVAFKLVQAFIKKYGEFYNIPAGYEKWLLDLVGIATLSDMVPLVGENRTLAYYGLIVLRKNRRLGLQKLFKKMNIDARNVVEDDITFMVSPRLNAASRMSSPKIAYNLLKTEDEVEANELSDELIRINDERKILVAQIFRGIKKTLEKREKKELIVIGDPSWRVGVLGLIASKLVEEYKCPCFVWGREGGELIKGSCRAFGAMNLVELMQSLPEGSLLGFGGHEMAGGFSVSHEQIHFLEDKLLKAYQTGKRPDLKDVPRSGLEEAVSPNKFDAKLSLRDVTMENYEAIQKLAPFGVGNQKPVFLFENLIINGIKKFGKNKDHLELTLIDPLSFSPCQGGEIRAMQFFKNEESYGVEIIKGKTINLLASFDLNNFGYSKSVRLRIVDIY